MSHFPIPKILVKTSALLLLLLAALSYSACEKDDICIEGDTPLLVIRFYDIDDTTQLKQAPSLRVIGLGQGETVDTFSDRSSTDSIGIPLRTAMNETEFTFILNSAGDDGAETGNIDTLRFSYETAEVFVSRACGYVANFDMLQGDLPTDASPWVQDIVIVSPSVQNQNSAHVKIYH